MKSGFQYSIHLISQYRLSIVITGVITFHAWIFIYSSGVTKHQSNDLTPQNLIISATMVNRTVSKSLSPANPASRALAPESVTLSKSDRTDNSDKNKHSDLNVIPSKALTSKRVYASNHAHASNNGHASTPAHARHRAHSKNESLADLSPNTHHLNRAPIHLANPTFKHNRPIPTYPQQALRLRQGGVVIIRVLISKSGQVTEATVQQSSGSAWLDHAAKHAALKAEFYPHLIDGVAQHSQADLPFNFVMK